MVAKRTGRAVIEIGKRALVESGKKCNRSSGREEPVNRETRVAAGGATRGAAVENGGEGDTGPSRECSAVLEMARAVESSPQNDQQVAREQGTDSHSKLPQGLVWLLGNCSRTAR